MPVSAKGLFFHSTSSKAGRRYVGAKGSVEATAPISEHNRLIEEKRKADLAARKAKKVQK